LTAGRTRSVADVFAQIDGEFAEFAPVLKLTTPAKSLVQHLAEETVAAAR
jgi:hypothetical protein